MTTKIDTAHRR